jgi:hypothetical protein
MSLFQSIPEVRKYIPIDANLPWEDFKPFIDEAEQAYIKGLLGDLYTPFLEDYTTNYNDVEQDNDMSADNKLLLPYIQRALAYYAALQSLPHMGVSVGSTGLQEQFGSNSRPAPRWKMRELQLQYITSADKHADILLQYMEDNASLTKYTEWFNDADANTSISGAIVYKTSIASQHIDINESRRLFLRLKKRIKVIEETDIKRMLCQEQYDELIEQLQADDVTAENQLLIDKLAPYISKKALYLTLPSLRVSVTDEGITMHSSSDGVVQKAAANQKDIETLKCSLKDDEQGYEADWKRFDQFLIDNISDYPLIESSTCYTSKVLTTPKYAPDNNAENKHFSV